jgi:uncharacterized protein
VRTLLRLTVALALILGGGLALAFVFQRRMLYFPDRMAESVALARAARAGLGPWRATDGSLRGWRVETHGAPRARALVFHGNAGSALDRDYFAAALARRGISVALLEYPGYGSRPGSPSERTLTAAAVEAVDALTAEGGEPIWLVGESLGSGVAARAARLRPDEIRGVLLVTPFARLVEVAHVHYPFLPGLLLRDRWAPQDDLATSTAPIAVLVAGRDEVVTAGQGRRLLASLPGPRRIWEQPQATHNGLDLRPEAPWWDEVVAFLATGSPERRP